MAKKSSPMWRKAGHPGFRSKKDEARGGTRAGVVKERIKERAAEAITRREPDRPDLRAAAARIKAEKEEREKAQAARKTEAQAARKAAAAKKAARDEAVARIRAEKEERKRAAAARRK